ncbi:MAG: hypothetical protein QM726_17815 [Chitinophagaceae bacterium]
MRIPLIVLFLLFTACIEAQTVTGNWYGLAEATAKGNNNNNYLTEFVIKQKGNKVEGVFSYYFRSGFQSYYIRGTFDPKTRLLVIKNIPVTYFKSRDIDGIDCPMDFVATYFKSRVKSTLNGSFVSQQKYKYTCPELAVSYSLDINEKDQDSLIASTDVNVKKYWKPRAEDFVINASDLSTTTVADHLIAESKKEAEHKSKDSVLALAAAPVKDSVVAKADTAVAIADNAIDKPITAIVIAKEKTVAPVEPDSAAFKLAEAAKKKELENLVASFQKRKTVVNTAMEIENDSVRISFYDNGIIDGDSITIFVNKIPVLVHQPLSEKALNMYLSVANIDKDTEVSMYAENLGKLPPNTALMVVTDGNNRKEVFLSSSLTQNASVILKKRKQ